jgi:transposase
MTFRVANDANGIRKLKRELLARNVELVVVEATGKWHRAVRRSLYADGIAVAEVDPYRVRNFARAQNILAKNDKLDASVLSLFAQTMNPQIRPPAPETMEELGELAHGRQSAVKEQTVLQNQLSASMSGFLRKHLQRRIARIAADIKALEKEIVRRIKADPGLARRYEILTSVPGIGVATAIAFIACLSELGSCNAKGIAKLVGVAPLDDDSGKRQGQRKIWGGRSAVRVSLYMAALTATQNNPDLKAYFDRLITTGKAYKQAIVAVMRKLVILANTLIAENRTWQRNAPQMA